MTGDPQDPAKPKLPRKYEEKFSLDMPMAEAVQRFAQVTQDELEQTKAPPMPALEDGEFHTVLFKEAEIRKVFHNGEWWFSVIDVMGALTGTMRASKYWTDLKKQLAEQEGFSEVSDFIGKLPLPAADGKFYPSDVATTETILRLIQSVRSPRAEPWLSHKRWG